MSMPRYPVAHEPWAECYLCGLDFPQSTMVRHYRTKKLVDVKCADERTHTDNLARVERRPEHEDITEQKVKS